MEQLLGFYFSPLLLRAPEPQLGFAAVFSRKASVLNSKEALSAGLAFLDPQQLRSSHSWGLLILMCF